jgi:uncharacterized protein (DUF608 family)
MTDQSFFVHLQTLLDFAQELQTQLGGLGTPIGKLSALQDTPMKLGAFGEATSLVTAQQAAIIEMSDLLGQVQQAISFAEDITKTVANGYQQADQNAAGSMQVTSGYSDNSGQTSGNESIWQAIFGDNSGQSNNQGGWT